MNNILFSSQERKEKHKTTFWILEKKTLSFCDDGFNLTNLTVLAVIIIKWYRLLQPESCVSMCWKTVLQQCRLLTYFYWEQKSVNFCKNKMFHFWQLSNYLSEWSAVWGGRVRSRSTLTSQHLLSSKYRYPNWYPRLNTETTEQFPCRSLICLAGMLGIDILMVYRDILLAANAGQLAVVGLRQGAELTTLTTTLVSRPCI